MNTDTEPGYFGKEDPGATAVEDGPGEDVVVEQPAAPAEPATGDAGGDDHRHMGHLDEGHTHGPTDSQYFRIFWVLFAITALEVSTYFWDEWFGSLDDDVVRRVGVAVLLTLMVVKFVMIAGLFMHLRFDAKLLRRVFIFGLVFAIAIYTVAMSVMNIWTDNGNPWFDDPPPAITTTTVPEAGA